MLIGYDKFRFILTSYRIVWIGGYTGSHKTSLAFYMARDLLERGYKLVTNCPCVWADDMEKIEWQGKHLKTVVVLDEGGLGLKMKRQLEEMCSYVNKMNIVLIIPSYWEPTPAAQRVTVQSIFGFPDLGIPLRCFKWTVKQMSFRDSGWFYWWKPSEVYGVYSRQDPGAKMDGIYNWLLDKVGEFRTKFGYGSEDAMGERDTSAELVEALDGFRAAMQEQGNITDIGIG